MLWFLSKQWQNKIEIFSVESKYVRIYCNVCSKYRIFKRYIYIFKKKLSLSIAYSKCGHEYEKIFKEEESVEILKIFDLINYIGEYQKICNPVWRKDKSRI